MPANTLVSVCPTDDLLSLFTSGDLAEQDAQLLEKHLLECRVCTRRLAERDDPLIDALRDSGIEPTYLDQADSIDRLIAKLIEIPSGVEDIDDQANSTAISGMTPPPAVARARDYLPANTPTQTVVPSTPVPPKNDDAELVKLLSPAESSDELGQLGGYRILKVLGKGGMGAVFLANDPRLNRQVAIKIMLPTHSTHAEDRRKRFLREARAVAAIEHDNIIPIYQTNVDQAHDVPYFVMPFLKGQPLDARLRNDHRLPLNVILQIAREMVEGLKAAHAVGLIHRDLKPENIWLEERGETLRVRILDFGLAAFEKSDEQLSVAGGIMGTPSYMSPEQARGDEADARSDLFSLGAVLYVLCTGKRPFQGKTVLNVLDAVRFTHPRAPREIAPEMPADLSELVMRLLEKKPADRPQRAEDVANVLKQIAANTSTLVPGNQEDKSPVAVVALTPGETGKYQQKFPKKSHLVGLRAVLHLLLVAAVVIVIKVKGKPDTEVEIPEGYKARFDDQGRLIVDVPPKDTGPGSGPIQSPAPKVASSLAHAQTLFDEGHLDGGMLWLVRALEQSPADDTALRRRILIALDMCRSELRKPIAVFPQPGGYVADVTFDPQGNHVLSVCNDGMARLWDIAEKKCIRQFVHGENERGINAVAFHPDGRIIATCGTWGFLLWDVATAKPLHGVMPLDGHGRSVAFSPNGKNLLIGVQSANQKGGPRVYELGNGKPKPLLVASRDRASADSVYSKDGSRFAACGWHGYGFYDSESGESGGEYSLEFDLERIVYSPDGKWILCGRGGGNAGYLVNVESRVSSNLIHPGGLNVYGVAISPDSSFALTGGTDGRIMLWDLITQQRTGPAISVLPSKQIDRLRYSKNGQLIVLASQGPNPGTNKGDVQVWHAPRPLKDDPKCIALWAKATTGKRLTEDGNIEKLPADEIKKLLAEVEALGGVPVMSGWRGVELKPVERELLRMPKEQIVFDFQKLVDQAKKLLPKPARRFVLHSDNARDGGYLVSQWSDESPFTLFTHELVSEKYIRLRPKVRDEVAVTLFKGRELKFLPVTENEAQHFELRKVGNSNRVMIIARLKPEMKEVALDANLDASKGKEKERGELFFNSKLDPTNTNQLWEILQATGGMRIMSATVIRDR